MPRTVASSTSSPRTRSSRRGSRQPGRRTAPGIPLSWAWAVDQGRQHRDRLGHDDDHVRGLPGVGVLKSGFLSRPPLLGGRLLVAASALILVPAAPPASAGTGGLVYRISDLET